MRRDKHNYYLDIADSVSKRGTCIRRNYGSVIVKDDVIIATGYTGAPRGRINCNDTNKCIRAEHNIPRGERYEFCRSVHSEANAIISASREQMIGSILYLVGRDAVTKELVQEANPCSMCKRLIINSGIKQIVVRRTDDVYEEIDVETFVLFDDSLNGSVGY